MDIYDFLKLAKKYSDLGDAIQSQLLAVVEGDSVDRQNPNAMRYALRFLQVAERHGVEDVEYLIEEINTALGE